MNVISRARPVLVADVGGTHVRFALVDVAARTPLIAGTTRRYRAAEFASFADAVRSYLDESAERPVSAVIAAAGLRVNGEVRLTNLPWVISRHAIETAFGFERATLINDFAAMALSVPLLEAHDLRAIGAPAPARFDIARIADLRDRRTGNGSRRRRTDRARATPVSRSKPKADTRALRRATQRKSRSCAVSPRASAMSRTSACCAAADWSISTKHCAKWMASPRAARRPRKSRRARTPTPRAGARSSVSRELLGAVAGDLALTFGAWDGVYLTGGLAPLLLAWIEAGGFRRRFEDKGRLSTAVARVPSAVVVHADAGLLGAAVQAMIEAGRFDVRVE